ELESKQLLAAYGVPVTNDALCTSAREAVGAAEAIGYPVVLKASSPDLLHKADAGVVALGLTTARAVRSAYAELTARAPDADGRPRADVGALVDVILKVQRLALDLHAELSELDINPLAVLPKGAVALDALAVPK